jgi:hypothetical protein
MPVCTARAGEDGVVGDICSGRKVAQRVVNRPLHAYKSAVQNHFTMENAKVT